MRKAGNDIFLEICHSHSPNFAEQRIYNRKIIIRKRDMQKSILPIRAWLGVSTWEGSHVTAD